MIVLLHLVADFGIIQAIDITVYSCCWWWRCWLRPWRRVDWCGRCWLPSGLKRKHLSASKRHEEETIHPTRGAGCSLDPILTEYRSVRFFVLAADSPVVSVLLFHGRILLKQQTLVDCNNCNFRTNMLLDAEFKSLWRDFKILRNLVYKFGSRLCDSAKVVLVWMIFFFFFFA